MKPSMPMMTPMTPMDNQNMSKMMSGMKTMMAAVYSPVGTGKTDTPLSGCKWNCGTGFGYRAVK
jgi:hypothetical protein